MTAGAAAMDVLFGAMAAHMSRLVPSVPDAERQRLTAP